MHGKQKLPLRYGFSSRDGGVSCLEIRMDGVGWGGVLFIWISFLWPILAALIIFVIRKDGNGSFKYWAISILGGYLFAWLIYIASSILVGLLYQSSTGAIQYFVFMSMALSFLAPLLMSFYVSKKYS